MQKYTLTIKPESEMGVISPLYREAYKCIAGKEIKDAYGAPGHSRWLIPDIITWNIPNRLLEIFPRRDGVPSITDVVVADAKLQSDSGTGDDNITIVEFGNIIRLGV
jgi:hypothetical protein